MWTEFKLPPINLWNVWPSQQMLELDMEIREKNGDLGLLMPDEAPDKWLDPHVD